MAFSGAQHFSTAKRCYRKHGSKNYHLTAAIKCEGFLSTLSRGDVIDRLNTASQRFFLTKKEYLEGFATVVHLLGRQDIAFRGHRDSGPLNQQSSSERNEGNLKAFLNVMIARGDVKISNYVNQAPRNALYLSWKIQNEFIDIISNHLRSKIIDEVNKAGFFSILADETSDVTDIEQLSLVVRYVHDLEDGTSVLKESFMGFSQAEDLTGEGLSNQIQQLINEWGLNMHQVRGQGYDGAASMAGKFNGVQAKIARRYPLAIYVHCACHCLNLKLSSSSSIPSIRRPLKTIQECITFLRGGPKRTKAMRDAIEAIFPDYNKTTLVALCTTRWVERHDAVVRFVELFPSVLQALNTLEQDHDTKTSDKAALFGPRLKSFEFIVSAVIIKFVAGAMLTLSRVLQKENNNLLSVCEMVEDTKQMFQFVIDDEGDRTFKDIYTQACKIADENLITIATRNLRSNPTDSEVKDYYRNNVFEPYIQYILSEISRRFGSHFQKVAKISDLLPINVVNCNIACPEDAKNLFGEVIDLYHADLVNVSDIVLQEIFTWVVKWKNANFFNLPDEAIRYATPLMFPNVRVLLKLFLTIPCTTASVERSFSDLKRLKTDLRNSCGEKRLTGLAMMALHGHQEIDYKEIVQTFLTIAPRR